jgi:hypothetical protein
VKVKPTEAERLRREIPLYESEKATGVTYKVLEPLDHRSHTDLVQRTFAKRVEQIQLLQVVRR